MPSRAQATGSGNRRAVWQRNGPKPHDTAAFGDETILRAERERSVTERKREVVGHALIAFRWLRSPARLPVHRMVTLYVDLSRGALPRTCAL